MVHSVNCASQFVTEIAKQSPVAFLSEFDYSDFIILITIQMFKLRYVLRFCQVKQYFRQFTPVVFSLNALIDENTCSHEGGKRRAVNRENLLQFHCAFAATKR